MMEEGRWKGGAVEDKGIGDEPRSVVCGGCLAHEFNPRTHPAVVAARDEEWPAWDLGS